MHPDVGEELAQRVAPMKFSRSNQVRDQTSGERLGHRANLDPRVRGHRALAFDVCEAVGGAPDLAVLRHHHGLESGDSLSLHRGLQLGPSRCLIERFRETAGLGCWRRLRPGNVTETGGHGRDQKRNPRQPAVYHRGSPGESQIGYRNRIPRQEAGSTVCRIPRTGRKPRLARRSKPGRRRAGRR
jgi:hypothetical protein